MKEKKMVKILISISCVMVIAVIVGILTVAAGYTVLIGDDFTHGVRVGAFHVSLPKYFVASLAYVQDLYFDWQGTFFAMFLQAFLSPVNNFGLAQLKAVMIGNALYFLMVLLRTVWTGLSFFGEKKGSRTLYLVILTILFAAVANADVYTEVYFWFSGAAAYSMPFSVCLTAILLFLVVNKERGDKAKLLRGGGKIIHPKKALHRACGGPVVFGLRRFADGSGSRLLSGASADVCFLAVGS